LKYLAKRRSAIRNRSPTFGAKIFANDRCSIHVIDSYHSANAPKPQENPTAEAWEATQPGLSADIWFDQFVVAGCI